MKTYNIKSSEYLFDKWLAVNAKSNGAVRYGGGIIQNDTIATTGDLNNWYKTITKEIQEAEKEFSKIIKDMYKLRDQTVDHIKNENPFG